MAIHQLDHGNSSQARHGAADAWVQVPILWTEKETARYIGKSPKWLERDRWEGPTIPYVKLGRSVRYRASDVIAVVDANLVRAR